MGKVRGAAGTASRGYPSFEAFQRAFGKAGPGKQWHHIVEQNPTNLQKFPLEQLHHPSNLIVVDTEVHRKINGHYSFKPEGLHGQRVRDWLSQKSFEEQRAYGIKILREFGVLP